MKLSRDIAAHPPALSQAEWELMVELLESEVRELPSEVRRTRASHMHDQLSNRLTTVRSLLEKLEQS